MRNPSQIVTAGLGFLAAILVRPALAAPDPVVRRLSPSTGQVGHVVVLQGSGLRGSDLQATFGRAQALVLGDSGRSDRFVLLRVPNKVDPRDPDTVTVTLRVDGVEAIPLAPPLEFTYDILQPLPDITDLTTSDPSRPRSVFPNEPFVLTLTGSNFLTARRAPERCLAVGPGGEATGELAGPASDTSVGCSFLGLRVAGDYTFWIAFSDGSGAHIDAPGFVEPGRIFGDPPVIQSVALEADPQQAVECDFSSIVENFLCTLGAPGAEAVPGVFIGGTYTRVAVRATVTDPNSTPAQNNILLVVASFAYPQEPREISLVLLDDGSANKFPSLQTVATVGEECTVDPAGACECFVRRYLIDSNDAAAGDAEYTRGLAFVDLRADPLLQDCIMERERQTLVRVPGDSVIDLKIEAIDRLGNLTVWPLRPTTNVAPTTFACTGDECGCCFLTSPNPAADCHGKPGMPSIDFPAGICLSLF